MANNEDNSNETESQLEALLSETDLSIYSEEARRAVDALLTPGQALEPGARSKFVEAANRAVRERGLKATAAIETLLFNARTEQSQLLAAVAAAVGIDSATLGAIERGDADLRTIEPNLLADWATAVTLDRESVENGIRHSLSRSVRTRSYARASSPELKDEDESFLQKVLRHFDASASGPAE